MLYLITQLSRHPITLILQYLLLLTLLFPISILLLLLLQWIQILPSTTHLLIHLLSLSLYIQLWHHLLPSLSLIILHLCILFLQLSHTPLQSLYLFLFILQHLILLLTTLKHQLIISLQCLQLPIVVQKMPLFQYESARDRIRPIDIEI